MSLLVLDRISKVYQSEDGDHLALDNVTFSLPSTGLMGVVGKSGSGKSTILNLIALLDVPSKGNVVFNNQDILEFKDKEKKKYRSEDIGIIFQHYNLLENETVLFNIMLPALIKGVKGSEAKERAVSLLNEIDFKKELYEEKCCNLSGGEKQRVAVLRAIINSPKILLADEPTGALDSKNSILIMNILKKISEDRLVIIVSHNLNLIKRYADRIISIKDGKVESIKERNVINSVRVKVSDIKTKHSSKWVKHLSFHNFKRHKKRNMFSIISLSIGLIASFLIIGFSSNATKAIRKETYKQINYGSLTIAKENKTGGDKTGISIVRMSRPSLDDIQEVKTIKNNYEIELNLDALLPMNAPLKYVNEELKDFSIEPVYDFSSPYIDTSLLKYGRLPRVENLEDVLINIKAYDFLKKRIGSSPIGKQIDVNYEYESTYYDEYLDEEGITDYYSFNHSFRIVGVVKELNFLSTPKIYYSYLAFKNYLSDIYLNNLSAYFARDYSWVDRIDECSENDAIGSYSYRLFHKNYLGFSDIGGDIENMKSPLVLTSPSEIKASALINLINAASKGMELFLIISLLGTALIMGIVSFSYYSEDKKISAILLCLGANRNDINDIYSLESILIGFISFAISIAVSPIMEKVINFFISKWIGFSSVIKVPFFKFLGLPFGLPLFVLMVTIMLSILSSAIPILVSKRISLREELKDE